MQLALKYILSLFIICSREYRANTQSHTFSLMFVKMPKRKRLRSHATEVVASVYECSKNSTGVNRLKISETMPVS